MQSPCLKGQNPYAYATINDEIRRRKGGHMGKQYDESEALQAVAAALLFASFGIGRRFTRPATVGLSKTTRRPTARGKEASTCKTRFTRP